MRHETTSGAAAAEPESRWARGKAAMDAVYGAGFSDRYPGRDSVTPYSLETVEHLFGEVWLRPGLSSRDRRLLVMGATASAGLEEPMFIQALSGLRNGELDPVQLREAGLQLAFYVGWPRATVLNRAYTAAIEEFEGDNDSA